MLALGYIAFQNRQKGLEMCIRDRYISPVKTGDYTVQICDSLWLNRSFRKVIEEKIAEAPLKQKRYVYSCLLYTSTSATWRCTSLL